MQLLVGVPLVALGTQARPFPLFPFGEKQVGVGGGSKSREDTKEVVSRFLWETCQLPSPP